MPFYVVGGMYQDTTFVDLVGAEPTTGPFATYEEAAEEWSGRARATIDIATTRYRIVEADVAPPAGGGAANFEA